MHLPRAIEAIFSPCIYRFLKNETSSEVYIYTSSPTNLKRLVSVMQLDDAVAERVDVLGNVSQPLILESDSTEYGMNALSFCEPVRRLEFRLSSFDNNVHNLYTVEYTNIVVPHFSVDASEIGYNCLDDMETCEEHVSNFNEDDYFPHTVVLPHLSPYLFSDFPSLHP